MDKIYLKEMIAAMRAELIRYRYIFAMLFVGVSFLLLALGIFWPKTYTTSAVLFADVTNIIEPLLKGSAEVTKIDRSEQASEVIYTKASLLSSAKECGLIKEGMSESKQNQLIAQMRSGVNIKQERNKNYFQVSYRAPNPDESFECLNAIINVFIEDTAKKKRAESVGAYNFIDAQVQTYKKQLELAEEKLKDFKSKNTDGSEDAVTARISGLRQQVENLKIQIEESQSRINTIQQQLNNEGHYLQAKGQIDELKQRRQLMSDKLEQLLLSYQENYPDVISLRSQIDELDLSISKLQESGDIYGNNDKVENPLYEELRKQLAEADVDLKAQKRRMQSLLGLQQQEVERKQRIAASQAELSELTRDYNVTQKVYEEMLRRKEAARLSMTLDIEGQGISYRIQEPANFPLMPSGLRFVHFAIVGPILGFLVPLGLLVFYLILDPHLRSARILQRQLPEEIEMIGVIPHYHSPIAARLLRKDTLLLLGLSSLLMISYLVIAVYWQMYRG